jgi:predicted transcriptional regulator
MELAVSKDELYTMMKRAVREVIGEKEIRHILHSLSEVSDKEMQEIIALHGEKPSPRRAAKRVRIKI